MHGIRAIDRRVAIKTVRSQHEQDNEEGAEALARFRQEARAAGRLSHPHIVGVYDYGETGAFAYIVMEFVEGRTLKDRLEEAGRMAPAEAGRIMLDVLSGLAYSHARGVIHRDIKPTNIMLTIDGEAKIADFGVARLENSDMTSVGTMIGTPSYMAPEQFLGEGVDARSDLYAAGVTLFHMLTGARPYEGGMTAIMARVLKPEGAAATRHRAVASDRPDDGRGHLARHGQGSRQPLPDRGRFLAGAQDRAGRTGGRGGNPRGRDQ